MNGNCSDKNVEACDSEACECLVEREFSVLSAGKQYCSVGCAIGTGCEHLECGCDDSYESRENIASATMRRSVVWTISLVLVAVVGSCSSEGTNESASRAAAELRPTQGNETSGIVEFEASGNRLLVSARVDGLSPGAHGIHVHEVGDCSAPDATSAGPHFVFDPTSDSMQDLIAGNLGELEAGATGAAGLERALERASLDGPHGILGRSVVVHSRGNDPSQPPDGDAGARIACGVIEVVSNTSG